MGAHDRRWLVKHIFIGIREKHIVWEPLLWLRMPSEGHLDLRESERHRKWNIYTYWMGGMNPRMCASNMARWDPHVREKLMRYTIHTCFQHPMHTPSPSPVSGIYDTLDIVYPLAPTPCLALSSTFSLKMVYKLVILLNIMTLFSYFVICTNMYFSSRFHNLCI